MITCLSVVVNCQFIADRSWCSISQSTLLWADSF